MSDDEELRDLAEERPTLLASMLERYHELAARMNVPNEQEAIDMEEDEQPACAAMSKTGFYVPWMSDL